MSYTVVVTRASSIYCYTPKYYVLILAVVLLKEVLYSYYLYQYIRRVEYGRTAVARVPCAIAR
jgi:hypothetical protein